MLVARIVVVLVLVLVLAKDVAILDMAAINVVVL